jgi:hypothetical protein
METFQHFMEFMKHYWSGLALVTTWAGIGIVALRRRRAWQRKQFLTRVNFSLNYVVGDQLAMRTLLEEEAVRVWPNEYGVRKVFGAAARASVEQPFLILADRKDQGFVNRAVLNALSEQFAQTYLAAALGLPICTATFVFAVCYEKYEDIRTLKLRVLVVEEQTLKRLFGPEALASRLQINNPIYRSRLNSLRTMHDLYLKDSTAEFPALGRVEMGVILPAGQPAGGESALCGMSASVHV